MLTRKELLDRIARAYPDLSPEERSQKLREIEDNVVKILSEHIEHHTIQFWRNDHPENETHRPVPHGSGVLTRLGDRHFIITASHVVEDHDKTVIGVYTQKKDFFQLGPFVNTPTAESENNNNTDIAVWFIEPDIVEDIAPLDWWYDLRDACYEHEESPEQRYLVYGFPATKVDIKLKEKELRQDPFKFQTRGYSHTSEGKRARKNEAINLLVEFHRKKVADVATGHREWAPDPHGMSGCGLWYLDPETRRYHLAGIMIEWKQPEEQLPILMATKIDMAIQAINYYDSKCKIQPD